MAAGSRAIVPADRGRAMDESPNTADRKPGLWRRWQAFGLRHTRLAALAVFASGVLLHAVLSHVFATAEAEEIEALLEELYVFQCVPLEPVERPAVGAVPRPTPLANQLRELDVTSVRVVFIERAVARLGRHLDDAVPVVADVLRYDQDLNARAGAVLALAYMGSDARPAVPELLVAATDTGEDIRLRRLILDKLPVFDPSPESVVPVLTAMLESESDPELRTKTIKALTDLGS